MIEKRAFPNVIPANFSPEFMKALVESLKAHSADYVLEYAVSRGQDPVFMKAAIKNAIRRHWGKLQKGRA